MEKVWIVQGTSAITPGMPMSAHRSEASADKAAADLVNILLGEAEMEPIATPDNYLERLGAMQLEKGWEEEADVWVTELDVQD